MRPRTVRLFVAAVCVLYLARPAAAIDGPKRSRAITINASPAILPAGTSCRVVLRPVEKGKDVVKVSYEGKIVGADDDGLTLRVTDERREVSFLPASGLPILNRLGRSIGIARATPGQEKEVRIAAETIQSATLIAGQGKASE